jgi:nicotinamidase-related amidase
VHDYYVVAAEDGCAAYVQADHAHSMSNIDRFFGQIAPTAEICAVWDGLKTRAAAAE